MLFSSLDAVITLSRTTAKPARSVYRGPESSKKKYIYILFPLFSETGYLPITDDIIRVRKETTGVLRKFSTTFSFSFFSYLYTIIYLFSLRDCNFIYVAFFFYSFKYWLLLFSPRMALVLNISVCVFVCVFLQTFKEFGYWEGFLSLNFFS